MIHLAEPPRDADPTTIVPHNRKSLACCYFIRSWGNFRFHTSRVVRSLPRFNESGFPSNRTRRLRRHVAGD